MTRSQPVARHPMPMHLWAAGLMLVLAPARLHAEAAPILLDGFFVDWIGPVEHVDPAGDGGGSGIDIRDLDLANDGEFLFVRFQLTAEIGLQASNSLVLYLDTDMNAATGTPVSGIGAELKWQLGAKTGTFYHGTTTTIKHSDIRLRQGPSITSPQFEIAIGRGVTIAGLPLFPGASLRALLRDESAGGDQAPNTGQTLAYTFDATPVPAPDVIPLSRLGSADVRLMAWNTLSLESGSNWNSATTPNADRIFSALDPDIVSLEEIYNHTAAQTAALLETFLPSGPGQAWYAAESQDCKLVTRFPIQQSWALDGNVAALVGSRSALGHDMLVVGCHLPCCANETGRQQEIDHLMSFFRDAKTPGGAVTVADSTLLVIAGDLNLVGLSRQLVTLLTGDIVDNATWGPDFAPDWDGTALADLVSRQTEKRQAYTWRNDAGTFAPGRLDFVIYSDAVVDMGNHFSLYSPEMSPAELATYGLQANDVTTVSDHLPHVADFRRRVPVDVAAGGGPGAGATRLAGLGARRGQARLLLTLGRAARVRLDIYDVRGARLATLRDEAAGTLPAGRHVFVWDGRTTRGARAASGAYLARLLAHGDGIDTVASSKLALVK